MSDIHAHALPSPEELRAKLPAGPTSLDTTRDARLALRAALRGGDPRLVVIAGPCSIHDPAAALEYADRLLAAARRFGDDLIVVMRAYFEKPRTELGWKGFIEDPDLDDSGDACVGLERARRLLLEITSRGLPCGSELLEPSLAFHMADLLSWAAIGARTVESPPHRAMASALPFPVGLKNRTDGSLEVAVRAIRVARTPQRCFGVSDAGRLAQLATAGNPDAHLVLRGGDRGENYDPRSVRRAAELLGPAPLARPILVDCSHANSGYTPERQARACASVLQQLSDAGAPLLGFMLESHLVGGRQTWRPGQPLAYGVSITDPCLGWPETSRLLEGAARSVARGRRTGRTSPVGLTARIPGTA